MQVIILVVLSRIEAGQKMTAFLPLEILNTTFKSIQFSTAELLHGAINCDLSMTVKCQCFPGLNMNWWLEMDWPFASMFVVVRKLQYLNIYGPPTTDSMHSAI